MRKLPDSRFIAVHLFLGLACMGGSFTAFALDFRGLVLGEPVTADQVEARFAECVAYSGGECDDFRKMLHERTRVRCGTGYEGSIVCNGSTTVAGQSARANIVIGSSGRLRRVILTDINSDYFDDISKELKAKFGPPASSNNSRVQNSFGAQYLQVEYVWTDGTRSSLYFSKFAGTVDKSSLYFSTPEDAESAKRTTTGDL